MFFTWDFCILTLQKSPWNLKFLLLSPTSSRSCINIPRDAHTHKGTVMKKNNRALRKLTKARHSSAILADLVSCTARDHFKRQILIRYWGGREGKEIHDRLCCEFLSLEFCLWFIIAKPYQPLIESFLSQPSRVAVSGLLRFPPGQPASLNANQMIRTLLWSCEGLYQQFGRNTVM